ncbi:MAG: anaerobic ribonucleoside-triphosphate reductase activating protein [Clostridia bacterium]|nr:anaerobic ribonucleoside-triphosphate reductase activating protein [Clostridia bacterium]
MRIAGLQKLTLLDFPGRLSATIFTSGCDLRCPFCHNASLVNDAENSDFSAEEILDFLKERKGRLTGLAITGGEPLLQADITEFIKQVKEIGYAVKLDTNGTYPEKLKVILREGLVDYVAMDIKNCFDSYPKTIGLENADKICGPLIDNVKESIELLKSSGIPFEFRTTIVKELHSKEEIEKMAKEIGAVDKYFIQSYVDSGDILNDFGFSAYSKNELLEILDLVKKYIPNAQLRGVD